MPDGKWSPTGTGISDWFAARGLWGLAGQTPPVPPQAPPTAPIEIGEWTPELFLYFLNEQYRAEEAAELNPEKAAALKAKNDALYSDAAAQLDAGVWGTAKQHGLPSHAKLFKNYEGWAETQMPEAPEAIVSKVEPFSKGGYDFVRQFDAQGNIIGTKFIGETPTEGMTEFQKANLEQQRAEFEQTTALQQSQLRISEMQSAAQLAAGGEGAWIERYIREYAQRAIALEEQQQGVKEQIRGQRGKLAEAGGPLGQIRRPIGLTITAQKAQEKIGRLGERAQRIGAQRRELEPLPPTPGWLPQFAPWLTEGEPITRGEMPTPSGQLLGRTPPSELAGLRGFTRWGGAGRSFEDIMAQAQAMLPQAPFGGRGRFRAARQI
ncbi:hypothetical protein LCGC14_0880510 [marine sediment metagenome]|uniref:Large polyvalent protein associated domain-containing protein n=1 Tax=marine sediment metagenome TaxID=412755 RepID=A0A0F9P711_9ZZZZ